MKYRLTHRRHALPAPHPLAIGLAAAVALATAGCSGSNVTEPIDSGPLYSCATETRAVPYAPNLTRTSTAGTYTAVLVTADPAPPIKGDNTWTVRILDANQMPVDGLSITPSANMPDHNHPPSVKASVTPAGNGSYTVMPLYLFMAGFWEVTLTLQPPGGAKDSVIFPICIPS
jgi:hypothetical protein